MSIDYKTAGVDIAAGEAVVEKIKPYIKRTRTSGVLSEIGLFGGFYDGRFPDMHQPVLVASTDGVGTKLKVAFLSGTHDTIGQDLVNHCVNDILACGARPLFFLDYFATGKLEVDVAADVIKGLAIACEQNGCALLGGETAEMPSMYAEGEYDLAGTVVGVVEKDLIVNGTNVRSGDVLIALPSTGLHTNGFSLARAALFPKYAIDQYVDELGTTISDALLKVHRSYLTPVLPLVNSGLVHGLSHITGGGIIGNTSRILPDGLSLSIDWTAWQRPPIFDLIQHAGSVPDADMQQAFNLGVGMVAIVAPDKADNVMDLLSSERPFIIGTVATA